MPPSKTFSSKKARHKAAPLADTPKDRTQYLSRSVAKSLEILELLQEPMALNEVARQIKLSKTSAFRLLCTLESSGYLTQSSAGRYNLVPEIHRVANSRFLIRLMQSATPLMCDLGRALRETINLAALFENRVEVIAIEESPEPLRMSNVIGHIVPPRREFYWGRSLRRFNRMSGARNSFAAAPGFIDLRLTPSPIARNCSGNSNASANRGLPPTGRNPLPMDTVSLSPYSAEEAMFRPGSASRCRS